MIDLKNTIKWISQNILLKSNIAILFFIIACLLTILAFPNDLISNEENYYQLSYKRVNPSAFPMFSAVFDSSNGRIVSELLLGNLVAYFDYDGAFIVGRLIAIVGFSLALATLFAQLGLRVIEAILFLSLFVLNGQQLFGGEWLFQAFGPKIPAYIFAIFAISLYLKQRYLWALAALVLATYFHFLVGLFWTIFIFSSVLITHRKTVPIIKYAAIYIVATLPLVYLLLPDLMSPAAEFKGMSADYIYASIRAPHHIAPFQDLVQFLTDWLPGIIELALLLLFAATFFKYFPNSKIALLTIVTLSYLAVFLVIAYLDRDTFFFAKFYLFRPTSLGLLLALISAATILKAHIDEKATPAYIALSLFIAFVVFEPIATKEARAFISDYSASIVTDELKTKIAEQTEPNDIILIDPVLGFKQAGVKAIRELERPTLVSWKFVPTTKVEIIKWYDLYTKKTDYFTAGCDKAPIDTEFFIVYGNDRFVPFKDCSTILYQNKNIIFAKKTAQ